MILYKEDEKRKIIMDYYLNKRNRVDSFNDPKYQSIYLHSNSCVDEITLYFNESKDDFKMLAKGCAIFLSSCEIFVEIIKKLGFENKTLLINLYTKLINKEYLDEQQKQMLDKLNVYENVSKHLNRKECALMITKVFLKI